MGAPSEYYVRPVNGNDSTGNGLSHATAWKTVQKALNTISQDTTNGDRINVCSEGDDVLTATLSFATYGTPGDQNPLIIQGYTSTAGDGGIGGISGGGSYSIINSVSLPKVQLVDMHLHNSGANSLVVVGSGWYVGNCEMNNCSGAYLWDDDGQAVITNSYFHDCSGIGVSTKNGIVAFCHFANGAKDFTYALRVNSATLKILNNSFDIDGTTVGIYGSAQDRTCIINNSIYSAGGSGSGIQLASDCIAPLILGNIIEGFSGSGGIGIEATSTTNILLLGYNCFYNNETNKSIAGDIWYDLGNDQTPGSSPFTNAASDDFTVNTSVKGLAYPTANRKGLSIRTYLDIGAFQRQEPAGGADVPTLRGRNSLLRR